MKWFLQGRINLNLLLVISPKYSRGTLKNWPIFSTCNPFSSQPFADRNYWYQFLYTSSVIFTKLKKYFNFSMNTNIFFRSLFKVTLKTGDTAPSNTLCFLREPHLGPGEGGRGVRDMKASKFPWAFWFSNTQKTTTTKSFPLRRIEGGLNNHVRQLPSVYLEEWGI